MRTFHAIQRTQERTGFNASTSERFIANAIERGQNAGAFPAKERAYLHRQETKQGCRTVVYNGFCFIINDDCCCVTMYRVPNWFGKGQYDGKQAIRNARRYARLNDSFGKEEIEYGLSQVS